MSEGPVAVLGGSGFIGTRLVTRLRRAGRPVFIVDRAPSAAHADLARLADLRDPAGLGETLRGADWVVNLAAEHRDDVEPSRRYHEVNVGGAEVLCRVLGAGGIRRLLFTSSAAVYGPSPDGAREDSAPRPADPYARSKLAAEAVYRRWAAEDPARTLVIVRPTAVFGEGSRGNVDRLLRAIVTGRFVMVGAGRNRKSVAYVENVATFLQHLLGAGPGTHLFNYADQPDLTMAELVALVRARTGRRAGPRVRLPYPLAYGIGLACDLVAGWTGRRLPVSAARVRKFCQDTRVSADRALAGGFRPEVGLVEALERVLAAEFGLGGRP